MAVSLQSVFRTPAVWVVLLVPLLGCVSVSDYRKLEREVVKLKRARESGAGQGEHLADLVSRVDSLSEELSALRGNVEVAQHEASLALQEARAARGAAAAQGAPDGSVPPSAPPRVGQPEAKLDVPVEAGSTPAEVEAYRSAYSAWRSGDTENCIGRFREFLQTYGASAYADDAAYWMADCYFKQGDYKTAILRFDDVVSRYSGSGKAADALYRQGEALLRLGPGYNKAASKAFERILAEYPKSPRGAEAKRQLDLLQSS